MHFNLVPKYRFNVEVDCMTNHQGCLTNHCSFFNASNDSAVLQITSALDWNIMSTTIHLEISHALFVSLFLCLKKKIQ